MTVCLWTLFRSSAIVRPCIITCRFIDSHYSLCRVHRGHCNDDMITINTQSTSQWDGLRHYPYQNYPTKGEYRWVSKRKILLMTDSTEDRLWMKPRTPRSCEMAFKVSRRLIIDRWGPPGLTRQTLPVTQSPHEHTFLTFLLIWLATICPPWTHLLPQRFRWPCSRDVKKTPISHFKEVRFSLFILDSSKHTWDRQGLNRKLWSPEKLGDGVVSKLVRRS